MGRRSRIVLLFALAASSCNAAPKPAASATTPTATTTATQTPAPSAVDAGVGPTVKLLAGGADPKTPLVYAFSTTTRTVHATISISASGASAGAVAQPPVRITFTATPKPNGASGATIDVKVTKLEIVMAKPSAKEAEQKALIEKAVVGMGGHFDATTHGDIENLDIETDKLSEGVRDLGGMLQQALELLIIPLPDEVVGVGAKWTKSETKTVATDGVTLATTATLTLQARDQDTATIKVDATNAGSMLISDPRAPKGSSMDRKTTASYTVVIRRDGVSRSVDGASTNDVTQKVPGQEDQTMNVKITQHLESE